MGLRELWVAFGKGRDTVWYPIHKYANHLGQRKSKALLFFHALSGCDTVSAFRNKGKKSFFQTWEVFPEITDTFYNLSNYPIEMTEKDEKW